MNAPYVCARGHLVDARQPRCPLCGEPVGPGGLPPQAPTGALPAAGPPPFPAGASRPVPPTRIGLAAAPPGPTGLPAPLPAMPFPPAAPLGPARFPPFATPTPAGGPLPVPRAGDRGAGRRTVIRESAERERKERPVFAWLAVLSGAHKGEDFRVRGERTTIGSAADNDIVLGDPYVSAQHAVIRLVEQEGERMFVLRDLDSRNGTFLNGSDEPCYHEEVIDSDTITFGAVECRFKCL